MRKRGRIVRGSWGSDQRRKTAVEKPEQQELSNGFTRTGKGKEDNLKKEGGPESGKVGTWEISDVNLTVPHGKANHSIRMRAPEGSRISIEKNREDH